MERIPLREFKIHLAEALVAAKLAHQVSFKEIGEVTTMTTYEEQAQPSQTGYKLSSHMLVETKRRSWCSSTSASCLRTKMNGCGRHLGAYRVGQCST